VILMIEAGNNIGNAGAKALGSHLVKLANMTTLDLSCAWWRWCLDVHRTWVFCWQYCVDDDCVVVCMCDVSEQHWRGRRQGTGPTPGEAGQHDNVGFEQCVEAMMFRRGWDMVECCENDGDVYFCVRA